MDKKIFVFLILSIILAFEAGAIGISGSILRHYIDFEPGYTREDTYTVTSREAYVSNYVIKPVLREGADLSPYLTITPNRIEGVQPGESVRFKVKIELPDKIDVPGQSLTWVRVEIEPAKDAGFMAYPSVALSYFVFVLYPFEYLEWSFSAPNMNENETADFTVSLQNLGEPTINSARADIQVLSTETNEEVRQLKTNSETNIKSRETRNLVAKFDSKGLKPGDYKAIATLYWDKNVSTNEQTFRIGTKAIRILNYTNLFEKDSINRMGIQTESAWNNRIINVYADISVFDKADGTTALKTFKSLSTDFNPWENKVLDAYFDTNGLAKGEYKIKIKLNYEGLSTTEEGTIRIDENIGAPVVEEVPGTFSLKDAVGSFMASITLMNFLILLLVLFILANMYLAYTLIKNRKKQSEPIDPAVVAHIKELKQKYNDSYIKEMMIKKGWSEEKVNLVLKEAGKK